MPVRWRFIRAIGHSYATSVGAAQALDDDVGPELAADVDEQPLGEGLDPHVRRRPGAASARSTNPIRSSTVNVPALPGLCSTATTSSSCSAAARSMTSRCPEVTGS